MVGITEYDTKAAIDYRRPEPIEIINPIREYAKNYLADEIRKRFGDKAKWLPCYEEIVDWMHDNHRKGLLLAGPCGLGKTVIGYDIIPEMLDVYYHYIITRVHAVELAKDPDRYISNPLIMVDDMGQENATKIYGNLRHAIPELIDAAEKYGKLLILTTNLTPEEITEKYDERTSSRLKQLTKCVIFSGDDMRVTQ